MALPTTIVSKGHWAGFLPPFKSSGGNFYAIARRSVTDDSIRIYKATDPSDSWTEQTTSPIVTIASVVSARQENDVIHISSYDSGTYEYHQFNMATDAYDVKDELIETPANAPTNPWISIDVEGTSVPKVVYAGDTDQVMGGKKERVDVNIRNGGTWDGPTALDAAGDIHYGNPNCVKASDSDDIHIVFQQTINVTDPPNSWSTSDARTIDAADTLSAVKNNTIDTGNVLLGIQNAVSFDDAGTQVIRFIGSNGLTGFTFMINEVSGNADWESMSQVVLASTSHTPKVNGETAIITIAIDTADDSLHVLWSNADDTDDIWYATSTDTGDTWTAEAEELDAVACNFISANIYVRGSDTVLAYVYDDAGDTKYNEKVLSIAAPVTPEIVPPWPQRIVHYTGRYH